MINDERPINDKINVPKKTKGRPRNNIMKLPCNVRLRIFEMLEDGRSYDDVRNDPEVINACKDRSVLRLHGTTFIAYRTGKEYKEYSKARIKRLKFK